MRPLKSHFPDHALHDLRNRAQADQEGACLSPCTSCPCGGRGSTRLRRLRHLPCGEFCLAQMGAALCPSRAPGVAGSPALRSTAQSHVRAGTAPRSPGRSYPSSMAPCFLPIGDAPNSNPVLSQQTGIQVGRASVRCLLNSTRKAMPAHQSARSHTCFGFSGMALSNSMPCKYQARRGEIIPPCVSAEDATIVVALSPCPGWAGDAAPSASHANTPAGPRPYQTPRSFSNGRRGCCYGRGVATPPPPVSPAACCSASSAPSSMAPRKSSIKSCRILMPRNCANISIKSW